MVGVGGSRAVDGGDLVGGGFVTVEMRKRE